MKYIIEIEDEPFGRNDDPNIPHGMDELWRAKGFRSLTFDKVGLSKLTPYVEPEDEIKVGDELIYCNSHKELRFVVTNINERSVVAADNLYKSCVVTVYTGITSDGEWVSTDNVKKTGRHFDKAVELLKEMKD